MQKLWSVILIVLTGCCINEDDMSFFQALLSGGGQRKAFLFIGDSYIEGSNNSTGPGPTPTAGTAFQYDNISAIIQIGSTDVVTVPANGGTIIPKMAIDYNAATGNKMVAICRGSSGSEYYPYLDNNNWSTTGTLRAAAETAVTNTLSLMDADSLEAIVVSLGINDVRSTNSLANITTAMDSFVTWLTTTYPGVPILFCQIGRDEGSSLSLRQLTVRNYLTTICKNNVDCHIVGNWAQFYGNGTFGADNLHPTQTNNNAVGAGIARWFTNSGYSKWCRGYLSMLNSDITSTRKGLLDTFFTGQIANDNLFQLEYLTIYANTNAADKNIDLTTLGYAFNGPNITHTANDCISTSSGYITHSLKSDVGFIRQSSTDFITCVRLKTKMSPDPTGVAMILDDNRISVGQNAAVNIGYRANNATLGTYASLFANSNTYGCGRSAGVEHFYLNGTSVANKSTSSSTATTFLQTGRRISPETFYNGSYRYVYSGKKSTLDVASLESALNTLVDNW